MLPGVAAGAELFVAQRAAFPTLRVQPWIPPLRGESLRAYAARLAPLVDPGRPCVVGGASFGGVVALELATHLDARACVLIGSVRSPAGLPWRYRMLRPLAALGPDGLRVIASLAGRRFRRLVRPEAAFVRWAMCEVVRWRPSPAVRGVRVFHIHGAADRVLPVALARPDVVVPNGRHALTVFSPAAVNEFIARVVTDVTV